MSNQKVWVAIMPSYGFMKKRWKEGATSKPTTEIPPVSKLLGPLFRPFEQDRDELEPKQAERPDYQKPKPMPNAGMRYPGEEVAQPGLPSNIGPVETESKVDDIQEKPKQAKKKATKKK